MIEFENYHDTSKSYDQTRTPIGIEILLGCLASTPRPLSEHRVLDAGCGTGNYITALKGKVGDLCGLEFNEGMLARAAREWEKPLDTQTKSPDPNAINLSCNMFVPQAVA
jgi:ubiquinone/menaquinone biosynthesis C-methylase UbiE